MLAEEMQPYRDLLDHFVKLLGEARDLRTSETDEPLPLKAAVIGYSYFDDIMNWGRDEFLYVDRFLTQPPYVTRLNHIVGCQEGYDAFLCLALGTLCGRFARGELNGEELSRREWVLIAFMGAHNDEICARYQEFLKREHGPDGG